MSDDSGMASIIGQDINKARLSRPISSAIARNAPVRHILVAGPPGSGKTRLAQAVASAVGDPCESLTMPIDLKALARFLYAFDGGVLALQRIDRVPRSDQRKLAILLEDGYLQHSKAKVYIRWLTVVGETSHPAGLTRELQRQFRIKLTLAPYVEEEMERLVALFAIQAELKCTSSLREAIAQAARGVPRNAHELVLTAKLLCSELGDEPEIDRVLEVCDIDDAEMQEPSNWNGGVPSRLTITDDVKMFVWRRDQGRCVRCYSNLLLEFDHIIPVALGGSSTARNIQLLCEQCNRSKGPRLV